MIDISKSVKLFTDSPLGEKHELKSYLVYGEVEAEFMRKAVSTPTEKFINSFYKHVNGTKPRINLMNCYQIDTKEGRYIFSESSGSVLRNWISAQGGHAQIDPYNLDRYQKNSNWNIHEKITSDNIDGKKQQDLIVSMLKKYVEFLENF